jgi:signal transduction histidine kinase
MEVEDQGRGIPEPLLDSFRRSTGTGVGLAGMRERVSEFHGSLDLESRQDHGTLLKVEMPLLPQSDEASASAPPTIQPELRTNPERTDNGGKMSRMTIAWEDR